MKRNILGLALVLAAAAGLAAAGRTQTAAQPADVLSELLAEVRGLRVAMEQMASAGPRVELALGRLQLQEQRVNNLARRLETVRGNLAAAQREVAQNEEQVRNFEAAQKNPTEPQQREEQEQLAFMMENLKRQIAGAQSEVQRLTAEEAQIATELATEQGRWAEINQRVEELERSLGRR